MTPFINHSLVDLARRDDVLWVFPHAQRTGGQAFRNKVLGAVFGLDRIYTYNPGGTRSKTWIEVTAQDLEGFRVYTGSPNYANLDKQRPCVFVGLLRHPLYRAVSLYFYCKRREGHTLHNLAKRSSLEEFYRKGARMLPNYFKETQCLRICGVRDARKAREVIEEKYIGVGFKSDVAGFGNALGAMLGWKPIQMRSVTSDEEMYEGLITPEFRERVLRESAEDVKLYDAMAAGTWPVAAPKRILAAPERGFWRLQSICLRALAKVTLS